MRTLSDAWHWYESTRRNLRRMHRLGDRYWLELPWTTGGIGRDDEFRTLEASEVVAGVATSLGPIDDLAILVLFSAFESMVRDHVADMMRPEADALSDPILFDAAKDAMQGVKEGSFSLYVLKPLQSQGRITPDLVARARQIRDYRNWVAHGRRDRPVNNTTPVQAYERLREFLEALGITPDPESARGGGPNGAVNEDTEQAPQNSPKDEP